MGDSGVGSIFLFVRELTIFDSLLLFIHDGVFEKGIRSNKKKRIEENKNKEKGRKYPFVA